MVLRISFNSFTHTTKFLDTEIQSVDDSFLLLDLKDTCRQSHPSRSFCINAKD